MKTAVFPGSFDPITRGHFDVAARATEIFDLVIVTVTNNAEKKYLFTLSERYELVKQAFAFMPKIKVVTLSALLADFVRENNAVLVKGIRNTSDFTYEYELYEINRTLAGCETFFFPSAKENLFISSTFVRELIKYNKDFAPYVPDNAVSGLSQFISKKNF